MTTDEIAAALAADLGGVDVAELPAELGAAIPAILRWASPDAAAVLGASPLLVTNPLAWLLSADEARAQPIPLHVGPPPSSDVYVTDSPETIKQVEIVGPRRALTVGATPAVWELERVVVPYGAVFVLKRIATYIYADPPGGGQGQIITTLGDTDPYVEFDDAAGALAVRWLLGQVEGQEESAALPIVGGQISEVLPMIPVDGIPVDWRDQRYAWGARFCDAHQTVIRGPSVVRLFVEVASAAAWTVRASGVLGGFYQSAGPQGRASIAATIPI